MSTLFDVDGTHSKTGFEATERAVAAADAAE